MTIGTGSLKKGCRVQGGQVQGGRVKREFDDVIYNRNAWLCGDPGKQQQYCKIIKYLRSVHQKWKEVIHQKTNCEILNLNNRRL